MSELDPVAKELIRKYMLTLVVLPASFLSVLGFALGWFINEGARGSAYARAYSDAQTEILKLASAAASSAANAASAEENAKQATEKLNKISTEAEVYGKKLNTVTKAEEGLANEVANALLNSPETLTLAIAQEYGQRLVKTENRIDSLEEESKLDNPSFRNQIISTILDMQKTAWVEPDLLNGWVDFDVGHNPSGYLKDNQGIVHLRGVVKSGKTDGSSIFILPENYRPSHRTLNTVLTQPNVVGRVDILPDGRVVAVQADSVWLSLDGINFKSK